MYLREKKQAALALEKLLFFNYIWAFGTQRGSSFVCGAGGLVQGCRYKEAVTGNKTTRGGTTGDPVPPLPKHGKVPFEFILPLPVLCQLLINEITIRFGRLMTCRRERETAGKEKAK